ncbi:MAG: NTP transferase domain-containing protein [Rhodobacteraceae bacterium]|nr:NTP transferase domain-containing protein [Paracoccaceae bacterium]MCY4196346.1 NTP transferase domain-containing protein [Paracoccaceae bacterium]
MALESRADQVRLVSPHDRILQLTSKFPDIAVVTAASRERGSMIRMAVDKLAPSTDAVLLLPTDCPDVTADELDRLIAAFSPSDGREICRLAWGDGISRPPALFGRRFFETLTELEGTGGAAAVAAAAQEFTVEIQADQEMTSNPKHRSFHNSV